MNHATNSNSNTPEKKDQASSQSSGGIPSSSTGTEHTSTPYKQDVSSSPGSLTPMRTSSSPSTGAVSSPMNSSFNSASPMSTTSQPPHHHRHVSSSHTSPTQRHSQSLQGKNTVFVGGIAYKVTEDELKKCFEAYGEVLDVFIVRDPENDYASKGYGFVTFVEHDPSLRVKAEGYVYLRGKVMNIGNAYRKQSNSNQASSKSTTSKQSTFPSYQPRVLEHQFASQYQYNPYAYNPYYSNYYVSPPHHSAAVPTAGAANGNSATSTSGAPPPAYINTTTASQQYPISFYPHPSMMQYAPQGYMMYPPHPVPLHPMHPSAQPLPQQGKQENSEETDTEEKILANLKERNNRSNTLNVPSTAGKAQEKESQSVAEKENVKQTENQTMSSSAEITTTAEKKKRLNRNSKQQQYSEATKQSASQTSVSSDQSTKRSK